MMVFKKGLGLILGCLMAISMIGCSNKIEHGEELLKENIQQDIKRNIEEYESQYDRLDSKKKLCLDSAKDIDKINVDIEELDDVYKATVTLNHKHTYYLKNLKDIFVLEIVKDRLTEKDLKYEDFLYETTYLKKVVAHTFTYREANGKLTTWLNCEEGYEGYTNDKYDNSYDDDYNIVIIMDNWEIEKDFFVSLGNLKFDV